MRGKLSKVTHYDGTQRHAHKMRRLDFQVIKHFQHIQRHSLKRIAIGNPVSE
ncbi:Uncharacterised protein [Vibrio cholerae]|nr:Uncharacterised protein [Vibrio cholerae]CSB20400.1 Uncharacterised protein [Vibrio cholerae]CSB82675.1 Uncharacterised protein [Vibrio cholerae]CSC99580.1 Uncharacterised protein [Vibrio cholerae]